MLSRSDRYNTQVFTMYGHRDALMTALDDEPALDCELMARDIRNAGLNPCNNGDRIANLLNNSGTDWWANWANALHGYSGSQGDPATGSVFGTAAGQRVAGTDSVQVLGAIDAGLSVAEDKEPAANFKPNDKRAATSKSPGLCSFKPT